MRLRVWGMVGAVGAALGLLSRLPGHGPDLRWAALAVAVLVGLALRARRRSARRDRPARQPSGRLALRSGRIRAGGRRAGRGAPMARDAVRFLERTGAPARKGLPAGTAGVAGGGRRPIPRPPEPGMAARNQFVVRQRVPPGPRPARGSGTPLADASRGIPRT